MIWFGEPKGWDGTPGHRRKKRGFLPVRLEGGQKGAVLRVCREGDRAKKPPSCASPTLWPGEPSTWAIQAQQVQRSGEIVARGSEDYSYGVCLHD